MIFNGPLRVVYAVLLFGLLCLIIFSSPAIANDPSATTIGGMTPADALFAGEKMYREGILPSGEPMRAFVRGDIPVRGDMFSCESCHLRSGLGSVEGTMIVFPVNAAKLFIPLHHGAEIQISPGRENLSDAFQGGDVRPAYTDETLAEAILGGQSATGDMLDETMPRYSLEEDEMEILIYYLNNLSARYSPGVTDTEMHLATVITEGVSVQKRDAMLKTLKTYIKIKNSQNRPQARRAKHGPWYRQGRFTPYRKLTLSVWELKGAADTWPQQLENYYSSEPVFALIGGLSSGTWEPIHKFSERKRLPSLFPLTDQPVVNDQDWYTLYFSKGPYQEGEAAAKFLRGVGTQAVTKTVVQLLRNNQASRKLAAGFSETWQNLGQSKPGEILISEEMLLDEDLVQRLTDQHPAATFLVWLEADDFEFINLLAKSKKTGKLVASAPMLGELVYQLPESARGKVYFTYPERLPENRRTRETVVKKWLEIHKVPIIDMDIQSKVYFIGWMLSGGLRMLSDEYYQDYFLDVLDMMNDEYFSIINYPRVSFGQGQRYAAKGCYIVQLEQGEKPRLVPRSAWVIQ